MPMDASLVGHHEPTVLRIAQFLSPADLFRAKDISRLFRRVCLTPQFWGTLSFPLLDHAPHNALEAIPTWDFSTSIMPMVDLLRPTRIMLRHGIIPPTPEQLSELGKRLLALQITAFGYWDALFDEPALFSRLLELLAAVPTLEELRIEGAAHFYGAQTVVDGISRLASLKILSLPFTGALLDDHVPRILAALPNLHTLRLAPCGSGARPTRVLDPLHALVSHLSKHINHDTSTHHHPSTATSKLHSLSINYRPYVAPYKADAGVEALFRESLAVPLRTLFLDKCPRPYVETTAQGMVHQDLLESFVRKQPQLESLYLSYRVDSSTAGSGAPCMGFTSLAINSASLKKLVLHTDGDNSDVLVACPRLEKLSLESFRGVVSVRTWDTLVGLRKLTLKCAGLTLGDVAALLDQAPLAGLEEASFRVENRRVSMMHPIAEAEYLAGVHIRHQALQWLFLSGARTIDCARLEIVAPQMVAAPLQRLRISGEIVLNGALLVAAEDVLDPTIHRLQLHPAPHVIYDS